MIASHRRQTFERDCIVSKVSGRIKNIRGKQILRRSC